MSNRKERLYADIFTGLVAASIGVALANLTWRVLGDPGGRVGGKLMEKPRQARSVDIDRLIALAPFGAAQPVSQTADATLQLRGILLAQTPASSAALISVGGAAPTPFYVGQQLGGGTIDSIEMDRVLLRTGSGVVALAFPDKSGSGPAANSSADIGPTQSNVAAIRALIPPASQGVVAIPSDTTPTSGASRAGPGLQPPPPQGDFTAMLGATSVKGGYRVGANLHPALRLAGLQPGDVIQRINGMAVGDPSRDAQVIGAVSTGGVAQLELLRNGQVVSLAMSLK